MKKMILRVVNNHQTKDIVLNGAKTVVQKAEKGTKYHLIDEHGNLITNAKAEVVGNDLAISVEGSQQPSLVLQDYQLHYPIENAQYLANTQASFATAESAAAAAEISAVASTSIASTLSTAQLVGLSLGAVTAATAGVVSETVRNHTSKSSSSSKSSMQSNHVENSVPQITLDQITNDNLIDYIESQQEKITITGSVTNANNGDIVTLKVGEAVSTGPVTDGRFAIEVDTKSLVVHQTVTATIANVSDSENYTVELPELTFDKVTSDNTINIDESKKSDIALTGSVTKAPENSTVKIVVGDQTFTAKVDAQGKFSLPVSGDLLSKNSVLKATVETPNKVVSQEVTHNYQVDLEAPKPTIDLNPITGDNKITSLEAKNELTTVTGTVTGVEDGQEVTVSCGCASCSGVQWIDMMAKVSNGEFKVDFKTADLLRANVNTVKASVTTKDAAENSATATDSETYTQPVELKTNATLGSANVNNRLTNLNDTNKINKAFADANPVIDYLVVVHGLGNYKLSQATIELNNGKTYKLENPNPRFKVQIPVSDLANGTKLKVTVTVVDPVTQATKDISNQLNYAYDVIAEIQATIDTINEDKTIAFADLGKEMLLKGTLTYDENDIRERDISMTLTAGGVTYTPEIVGKTWSVKVPMSVLANAEGTQKVAIEVTAKDKMDNPAKATVEKEYQVDTVAPEVKLSLDPIAGDNAISADERSGNITIKGKVEGELTAGTKVKLLVNGQTTEVEVSSDGTFTHNVATNVLVDNPTMVVSATYLATDAVGNSTTVDASQSYSLKNGDIDIKLDSITADDLINVTEKSANVTISGDISGSAAQAGQKVKIVVNNQEKEATVGDDLKFKLEVPASDFIATDKYVVKASVTGNNNASANTARAYSVDKEVVAQIDIKKVGDFSLNIGEIDPLIRIKGNVEFTDAYAVGLNHKRLLEVKVKFGDKVYKAGFHDKQFFLDIPASELAELTGKDVSLSFSLATGVKGDYHNNIYGLTKKDDGSYATWISYGTEAPIVQKVTFDSPHLEKQSDTSYKVNYKAEQQVEVSGTVTAAANSSVKVGDTVVVKVGEKSYETKVQAGNTFSTMVDKKALAQTDKVTATLTTKDLAEKEIQVSDVERVATPSNVSSKHVIVQNQPPKEINNDHSTDGYNFPYFIEKLGGIRGAVKTVLGGESTPLVYKYHIVTKAELADPANIESSREVNAKYEDYIGADVFHSQFISDFRAAYAEIGKYINVNFVEVDTVAEADTNVYIAAAEKLRGYAAWAWSGYNIIWNGGISYEKPTINYSFYTALHEIGHTLDMAHSSNGFKNTFRAKEDTLELTNMSYNNGVKDNLFYNLKTLRMYDIAYLQYQFGVNKTARAGNDVYTFKAYNAYSPDGDIYIWDGAGVDTFDASNEEKGVNVDLTPGSWIYVGEEREQTLVIKEAKTYTPQEYFGMPKETVITDRLWKSLGNTTFNEYTKGQAFIGFGTQIENLVGSAHNDNLTGNVADNNIYGGAGNDNIKGGAGNDYLDGGEGTDTLAGGLGNDTYVVENLSDTITENADEGDDTVLSAVNFDLTTLTNVENITLIGTTANAATGNALNNTLVANNIGNTLTGGVGDDRLVGGLGADTLIGGEGSDTFVFNTTLNGKIDTIDLQSGDKIEFSRKIFTALTPDNVNEFISLQEGKLYYDSDKSGPNEPVHFATTTGLINELSQVQFVVV
ncbi:Ig-like domain-containing protein [Glaesserella parasuis]|nr:Ig-like domain-containing protein [Glaesserella parasuis]